MPRMLHLLLYVLTTLFVISVLILLKDGNSPPTINTNNKFSEVLSGLRSAPLSRALQSVPISNPTRIVPTKPLTGHHLNNNTVHKKAWMHLQEVNGLKNEEVVMVVTSTEANEGYYIRER